MWEQATDEGEGKASYQGASSTKLFDMMSFHESPFSTTTYRTTTDKLQILRTCSHRSDRNSLLFELLEQIAADFGVVAVLHPGDHDRQKYPGNTDYDD